MLIFIFFLYSKLGMLGVYEALAHTKGLFCYGKKHLDDWELTQTKEKVWFSSWPHKFSNIYRKQRFVFRAAQHVSKSLEYSEMQYQKKP